MTRRLPVELELLERAHGAVIKAREAHDCGDIDDLEGLLGAAEENLGRLRVRLARLLDEKLRLGGVA
jgi:hypothetical protein